MSSSFILSTIIHTLFLQNTYSFA